MRSADSSRATARRRRLDGTRRKDINIWPGLGYDDAIAQRAWLSRLGFEEGIRRRRRRPRGAALRCSGPTAGAPAIHFAAKDETYPGPSGPATFTSSSPTPTRSTPGPARSTQRWCETWPKRTMDHEGSRSPTRGKRMEFRNIRGLSSNHRRCPPASPSRRTESSARSPVSTSVYRRRPSRLSSTSATAWIWANGPRGRATFQCCLGGMHLEPVTIHHDGSQVGAR